MGDRGFFVNIIYLNVRPILRVSYLLSCALKKKGTGESRTKVFLQCMFSASFYVQIHKQGKVILLSLQKVLQY